MFNWGNITKGKIESLIGLVIIIAAIASVFIDKADWTQASIALLIGIGLLGFKMPNGGSGTGMQMMVVFCILLSACGPKCPVLSEENKTKNSIYVKEVLGVDTILVAGDSVKVTIKNPCPDGYSKEFEKGLKKGIKKQSKKAIVSITKNEKGDLEIDCECTKEQKLINSKNLEIYRLHTELNKKVFVKETFKTHWYDIAGRWALGILFLILAFVIGRLFI